MHPTRLTASRRRLRCGVAVTSTSLENAVAFGLPLNESLVAAAGRVRQSRDVMSVILDLCLILNRSRFDRLVDRVDSKWLKPQGRPGKTPLAYGPCGNRRAGVYGSLSAGGGPGE